MSRRHLRRAVAITLMVGVAAAATAVTESTTATALAQATQPGSIAPLIPIPHGYPTVPVTVVATVQPPLGIHCVTMRTADGGHYRLLVTRATKDATGARRMVRPATLWITGSAVPYIDRDDSQPLVARTPGCPRLPAFMATHIRSVQQALRGLATVSWPALVADLSPGPPGSATRTPQPAPHQPAPARPASVAP